MRNVDMFVLGFACGILTFVLVMGIVGYIVREIRNSEINGRPASLIVVENFPCEELRAHVAYSRPTC